MTVYGVGRKYVNGETIDEDYTSKISVSNGTYLNKACTVYTIPLDSTYSYRFVNAYHIENLSSSHEYNLKFSWNSGLPNNTLFDVTLVFYDSSGNILREQVLYTHDDIVSGWRDVDIDFKPDASGLGGYKTRLEFTFCFFSSSVANFRLSEVIEFTDKDDNSSWFEKIIQAIRDVPSNIVESIHSLPERLKTFFDNLGQKFSDVGNSIVNKFEQVKNDIGVFFDNIGEKLSNKFEAVGNAITNKFTEIGDKFSATFDKFKPRFYEQLNWVIGFINPNNGEYGQSNNNACVTDYFLVSDSSYYIERNDPNSEFQFLTVAKYDLNKTYISSFQVNNFSVYELEPGYYYRFRLYKGSDLRPYGDALSDYCNEYVLLYADEGWLSAFGHYILNGLKSLFIPSDDYFDIVLDNFEKLYVDHFGIFAQVQVFFEDTLTHFKNLLSDDYIFIFPEVSVPINGHTFILIEKQTVDMSIWLSGDSWSSRLYKIYRLCASAVIVFAVLQYASKVEHVVLGVNNYDFIVDRM